MFPSNATFIKKNIIMPECIHEWRFIMACLMLYISLGGNVTLDSIL